VAPCLFKGVRVMGWRVEDRLLGGQDQWIIDLVTWRHGSRLGKILPQSFSLGLSKGVDVGELFLGVIGGSKRGGTVNVKKVVEVRSEVGSCRVLIGADIGGRTKGKSSTATLCRR